MLGYFDPLLPGELLHSAIARSARLSGIKAPYESGVRILSKQAHPSFGLRFPANANALIANVPQALGLDADTALAHSLYPAFAPFLEDARRQQLRVSIFTAARGHKGVRGFNTPLRYCPKCAAVDFDRHRTVYWHVAPQHPGVTACDECGCALVESKAAPSLNQCLLYAPEWIDRNHTPVPATAPEMELARDLRWLLSQNKLHPGGRRLTQELRNVLLARPEYRRGTRYLNSPCVFGDVKSHFTENLLLKIGLKYEWQLHRAISRSGCRSVNFHAYSVIARIAGIPLPELFSLAMKPARNAAGKLPVIKGGDDKLAIAKTKVSQYLSDHPQAGLTQLRLARKVWFEVLLAHAPEWCAANLPAAKRGRNVSSWRSVDWEHRDREMAAAVAQAKDLLLNQEALVEPSRITLGRLLSGMGLNKWLKPHERMRLPLTKAAIDSALDTRASYVKRRATWFTARNALTKRRVSFKAFLFLSGLRYDCDSCSIAREAAIAIWKDYIGATDYFDLGGLNSATAAA